MLGSFLCSFHYSRCCSVYYCCSTKMCGQWSMQAQHGARCRMFVFLLPCFVLYGCTWTRSGKESKFWLWVLAHSCFQLWLLTVSNKSGFSCNHALQVIAVASTWHSTAALKQMYVYKHMPMGPEFLMWLASF